MRGAVGWSIFAFVAILGLAPACSSQEASTEYPDLVATPYVDADAYSIYAILLEDTHHPVFVVQSETESWALATPEKMGIKGDRTFQRVWGTALRDLAKQYRQPRLLMPDIPMVAPYELLSTAQARQREAYYYYSFSAVGFDPQKRHAIVTMNHFCGALCGGGESHFFVKKNGKWREVSVKASLEVWAS